MTKEQFEEKLPLIMAWIDQTIASHSSDATRVAARGFSRLPQYFSAELLASTKVIYVDVVPTPPLSAFGLTQFPEFENMVSNGITFLDTFFVQEDLLDDERLHFHELVHVLQWRIMGPKSFVAAYAEGLERFGYRDSPLEEMAYDLDARFQRESLSFNVEQIVRQRLTERYAQE